MNANVPKQKLKLADSVAAVDAKQAQEERYEYVVVKDFSQIVGEVLVSLPKGKVITDQTLIAKLRAARAPIVPAGMEKNLCVCPSCKHVFVNPVKATGSAQ